MFQGRKEIRNLFALIIASIVLCGFTGAYAQTPTPDADLNGDGTVDETDLLLLLGQWHVGEPYTPTPTETPFTPTPTVTSTRSKGPAEITVDLPGLAEGAKPLVMGRIPAGSFEMGSPDTERSRWCDEGPVHTVNIGYDFYMGKYEVTQAQWQAVMGSNPAFGYGVGNDYPVYYVSWNDCQSFITALNALGQGTFRLPSEAEWEYACRAGATTRFYFGDSLGCDDDCSDCAAGVLAGNRSDYMWYCGNNSPSGTKPVGGKLPNAFGLYDMSGNVWEWCQDYWRYDYTGAPGDGSAWVSPMSGYRVGRGGYWRYYARFCRSAVRSNSGPTCTYNGFGFRLCRTP